MGRRPEIDWEPIKVMYVAGKTANELAHIFGISLSAIMKKSMKDKWGLLRDALKNAPPTPKLDYPPKSLRKTRDESKEIGFDVENTVSRNSSQNSLIERAGFVRNADNFRERVVKQADKALETLEKVVVSNVFECDRFAEALTKVERIGARAYGYDREGDHPIINIGILGSGSEYDPV